MALALDFDSTLPAFIVFVFSYVLYMHHIISWGYFWLPQYIEIFEGECEFLVATASVMCDLRTM